MSEKLVIWGSSGHAKVVRSIAAALGMEVVVTIDNCPSAKPIHENIPLFIGDRGLEEFLLNYRSSPIRFCAVAVGGRRGGDRIELLNLMEAKGMQPAILIHPSASVDASAQIGRGVQVLAGAVVAADAHIDRAVILNHNCTIDHESQVGEGTHVAPGATICGCVNIGRRVFVGAGAVILPRLTIGDDAVIGAGAVVAKNVDACSIVVGVPARVKETA